LFQTLVKIVLLDFNSAISNFKNVGANGSGMLIAIKTADRAAKIAIRVNTYRFIGLRFIRNFSIM